MNEQDMLRLWGKTNRYEKKMNPTLPDKYHPLLFHLLDVAHCAGCLWDRLPNRLQRGIATALGLDEGPNNTKYAVMLLAGLHDLGKACPPFQHQSEAFRANVTLQFAADTDEHNRPHGFVSAKEIARMMTEPSSGLSWKADQPTAIILAAITGGHHGTFPLSIQLEEIAQQTLGTMQWTEAREYLVRTLQSLLYDGEPPFLVTTGILSPALTPLLAGLISVADWFGSSSHFPIEGPKEITKYVSSSRTTASHALNQSGWRFPCEPPKPAPIESVFEYLVAGKTDGKARPLRFVANAVQRAVAERAHNALEPYLLIVESAMGSGKTEGALYAADCALVNGLSHGFYIALPTQATTNAMYARVLDYFNKGQRHSSWINMPLIHANAGLDEDYLKLVVDGPIYDDIGNDKADEGSVIAHRWFAEQKKQALLAPFGVGTIDQALLSVLQTRHWFVRLFGLAERTVIFDEVHAYDVYMGEILHRLIAWLAEIRCPVILLSATLPANKRRELVDAYRSGASRLLQDRENEEEALGQKVTYPRLTFINQQLAEPISIYMTEKERNNDAKTIALQFAGSDKAGILQSIQKNVPDGACVAVICNTVDRAQKVYEHLRDALNPNVWKVTLFHARAPFVWRKAWEDSALDAFGKDSGDKGRIVRPNQVLVATQVIEQSLDLDFDFMLSDMAPVDLLLQRMGRLHRHKRARSGGTKEPRFVVLCDGDQYGPPPSFPEYSDKVYERYVLLRSWLAIRERDHIALPDIIQPLITEVYDQEEPQCLTYHSAEFNELWLKELQDAKDASIRKTLNSAAEAGRHLVALPDDFSPDMFNAQLRESDDPRTSRMIRAATRNPEQVSIQAICFGSSEEGLPLSKNYRPSLDGEKMKAMLGYVISIHTEHIFLGLLKNGQKPGWGKNPYLRHCYDLQFDGGTCTQFKLRLSNELGLVIGKGAN